MIVFGTRPEAIKMAPVVQEFMACPDSFDVVVALTGQHRELLDQVMNLFAIKSDYDLDVMTDGQDLFEVTARVLIGMRDILDAERPDMVLVHGDTATSTAAALAAFYRQIPVGHVEAGLRSFQRYSPFPEEMNRVLTSQLTSLHFSPTQASKQNLLKQGIGDEAVNITGNTVIDAILGVAGRDEHQASWAAFNEGRRGILLTMHRRENFGQGIVEVCRALREVLKEFPDVEIIYPVHPNPNVRGVVQEHLANVERMRLIDPVDYLEFVQLMNQAYLVVTDSGGIQEEAPSLGKPVLVLRNCTERPEAVTAGTADLIGTDQQTIVEKISLLLNDGAAYDRMAKAVNPYGDGLAARRIVARVAREFSLDLGENYSTVQEFDPGSLPRSD